MHHMIQFKHILVIATVSAATFFLIQALQAPKTPATV